MCPSVCRLQRPLPLILAICLGAALSFAGPPAASAQPKPPPCDITGPETSCGSAELCGPEGRTLTYEWTGPGGFTASTRCIRVRVGGTYRLEVTDTATGLKSEVCEHKITVDPPPPCVIRGPGSVCPGGKAELCGPPGDFDYAWEGPGGFTAQTQCISATDPGEYVLRVTDRTTKCVSRCFHVLRPCPPEDNCPRTPGFWSQQCAQRGNGSTKFSARELARIARCVDEVSSFFDWGDATAGFCEAIDPARPMDVRKQAKRHFAALLANVCTGRLGLVASNGDRIRLSPDTRISCDGLEARTIHELILEVDRHLRRLDGRDLRASDVKDAYSKIGACLDAINNGEGIGPVCPKPLKDANAVEIEPELGEADVDLFPAKPNPFGSATRISFAVSGSGADVEVGVYDLAGRQLRKLAGGFHAAGRHEVTWNGADRDGNQVRPGVYFVRVAVGGRQMAMPIVYMK